jgi:septal ring factor EnvC (AmiA/AmiB activator)
MNPVGKSSILVNSKPSKTAFLLFVGVMAMLIFISPFSYAQSKRDLEKKREALHKDIEYTNQLLKQTKKNKSASLNQLVTLNKKISYRSELISNINTEITSVDKEIGHVSTNIDSLNSRLSELRKQYGQMLYYAYRNQSAFSKIMFVFSASDFNQAFKRIQYLRQLSQYRINQRDAIVAVQDSLNGKKVKLQEVKQDKTELLVSQKKEKNQLSKEKEEQVSMLNNLTSREKKLRAELKEKSRQEQNLANKIEDIIRKEIELAKAANKRQSNSTMTANASKRKTDVPNVTASVLSNTPETIKLSNDFENNRGRLPWPVEQGIISSSFGRHAHPVWKDVVTNNNGININSAKGAKARSIFDGKVIRVLLVVDKYAVLVQHGEYFTLYSNLEQVFVKAGDKVITRQPLGIIQTNEDEGKTELHLEVWRGSNKMDPEQWIASRR